MNKIKRTQAGCLYVFQGRSCANCEIVRNLAGAKEFIRSANERFEGYMKIKKYSLTQDTWTLLVELQDEQTIRDTYLTNRRKSKKAIKKHVFREIWRMVSDCIRHWLSRFVKWSNFHDKREGSLRLKRYERYFFESLNEAERYMQDMEDQKIGRPQKNVRFRPDKKKWVIRKIGIGHIYMTVKHVTQEKMVSELGVGALDLMSYSIDVLRQLLVNTQNTHFSHFQSKTHHAKPQ